MCVHKQTLHKKQLDDKKSLMYSGTQVDDMYEMLAIYEQKVPTGDQVKHDDLREALAHFVEELRTGKEFLADHKASQIDTLSTNVQELNEEIMNILRTLHTGDLVGQRLGVFSSSVS